MFCLLTGKVRGKNVTFLTSRIVKRPDLYYPCKHVSTETVVRAQNKCEIRKCFAGKVTAGKNVTGVMNVFKKYE